MPVFGSKAHPSKNQALLVSVMEFYHGVPLAPRRGVKKDTKRLHKILSGLGFQVTIHNDLTAEEIRHVFKTASLEMGGTCFVGVLSSHGEEGLVFGADGNAVRLAEIFSWFGDPGTAGVTKLFFVQACRGNELDSGVELEADGVSVSEGDSFSPYLSIPINSAAMFATAPGYAAFLHPLGSVFLQTLCDLLEEEGGRSLEVTQLMTRLNYRVAHNFEAKGRDLGGKKEMPCFVTRLTRQVFPFADRLKEPLPL
ncbi:CASP7 protein, partial [Polyodon spathula]|nr:CASP7 protein [Polyodon spathula]